MASRVESVTEALSEGAGTRNSRARQDWPGKTLFIILDAGTAIRNILRTGVFEILKKEKWLRIVIFSPITDAEFKAEFESENVIVEPVQFWKPNGLVKMLRSLRKDVWIQQFELARFKEKRTKKSRWMTNLFTTLFLRKKDIRTSVNHLQRWEDVCTPALGQNYFDQYNPDLVFYATIYSRDLCLELAAKQRGIKTAAFILSWDNPTTKGPFPVRPNRVVLWNDILRRELMTYHQYNASELCVAGVPQFDIYANRAAYLSREQFFKKWKLNPAKRLITYTTGTPGTAPFDHEIVHLLYERMQAGAFHEPCQLLVRLHPKDILEVYKSLENKPDLIIQLPGRRARTNDSWNPTREDMYGLAELMCYSDVVVNIASTITIDAAAFDTPIVNVAFDGYKPKPLDQSCRRYYDYEHYKRLVQTAGFKISYSIDDLVKHIQEYLNDRSLDGAGRARIREEQCWKLDGQAGRRIAEFLLDYIRE